MAAVWLSDILFAAAYGAIGAVFALLLLLYLRVRKLKQASEREPVQEFTNMLILVQTMREVIFQQKTLAREFNKHLEAKVNVVNEVMRRAREDHEKLCESQRQLARRLHELRRGPDGSQGVFADGAGTAAAPSASPRTVPADAAVAPRGVNPRAPATLHVVAEPQESDVSGSLLDTWVGLDFGAEEPDLEEFPVPEETPEAPEDPESARKAFRALLNMETDATRAKPNAAKTARGKDDSGNGRDKTAPLRTRVYQYADAGMSVAQIARELGIGKGEVRLIMSLREKK